MFFETSCGDHGATNIARRDFVERVRIGVESLDPQILATARPQNVVENFFLREGFQAPALAPCADHVSGPPLVLKPLGEGDPPSRTDRRKSGRFTRHLPPPRLRSRTRSCRS